VSYGYFNPESDEAYSKYCAESGRLDSLARCVEALAPVLNNPDREKPPRGAVEALAACFKAIQDIASRSSLKPE